MKFLEELLAKDNENISLLPDLPLRPTEPQGFSPDQMLRCEGCLRPNPPTRVECLYCGHVLPLSEAATSLVTPALRPPEKWEHGYNLILMKVAAGDLSDDAVNKASDLLRLEVEDLKRILTAKTSLPLARTAAQAEAAVLDRSLGALGLETTIVSDANLAADAASPRRLRTLDLNENNFVAYQTSGSEKTVIDWTAVTLIVTARLIARQVEIKERKGRGSLKQIENASETMSDEEVVDIHTSGHEAAWRITSNSFDFSCLEGRKTLLSSENFSTLIALILERASNAAHDNAYNGVRRALELVWPSEPQTVSGGWHRERAGKYSTREVTMSTNEPQFTRYSQLRHLLRNVPI